MTASRSFRIMTAICPLALLAACGGGGAGGIASGPAPLPSPAPSPAPTPTPEPREVIRPEVIALEVESPTAIFAVSEKDELPATRSRELVGSKQSELITQSRPGARSETISLSYGPQKDAYSIALPDGSAGELVLKYLNGTFGQIASSTGHTIDGPDGDPGVLVTMPVPSWEGYPYTYSQLGFWTRTVEHEDDTATQTWGTFVYGHQTPAGAVPIVGSASYQGGILAYSPRDPFEVDGSVNLTFDFGAGALSGSIHPRHYTNGFYSYYDYDYGVYDFARTVYAKGSSRYSGQFSKDGVVLGDSWFEGALTGPGAEEAIGRFVAPFTRDGTPGAISGIWIGKRD